MSRQILSFLAGCAVATALVALAWAPRGGAPAPTAKSGPGASEAAVETGGPAASPPQDGGVNALPHTATIQCRLVMPAGIPMPSRVRAWWGNERTEADLVDGLLTIHVPPVAGHASFLVDGCVVIERDVAPIGGGVTDWGTITMVASATLSGYVVDVAGRPVVAFVVARVGTASIPLTRTDETGAFTFDGLPYGDAELRVESEGFVTRTEHHRFVAGAKPAQLTVVRGGGVRGAVLDASGHAAPRAVYVEFVARDDPDAVDRTGFAHLDDDGRFEIRLLPGRYRAYARGDSLSASADLDVVDGEIRELTLQLRTR